jgi:purine-nucleoside phosphorylase
MLYDNIQEALAFLRTKTAFQPRTGIVLGTGLGHLTDDIEVELSVAYADIPHFVSSTVESHQGRLVFGYLGGHPVVVMAGRFHYYEGWSMQQITFPVRVMKALGAERLIITNASGGVNPHLQAGDIVVVKDHINLLPDNPLRGPNDERIGPRFPDMSEPYDLRLRTAALSISQEFHIQAIEGIYSALPGPNLETPAEYGMLRRMGSDCTGMSSIPEVLVARHQNMAVLMLSLVANVAWPPSAIRETTLEDVVRVAQAAEPKLRKIVRTLLERVMIS